MTGTDPAGGPVFAAAVALVLLRLAGSLALSALNRRNVGRHASEPPPAIASLMDRATYDRSVAYTLAKSRFGSLTEVVDAAVLIALLRAGLFPWMYRIVEHAGGRDAAWTGAAFLVAVGVLLGLASLPFEAWENFRIERAFGFNRMGLGLWFADQVKHALIGAVLGFAVLWGLLALVPRLGGAWWVAGALGVFLVQLALLILYPRLILPLFNRLTPLPPGELRSRLVALGERTGFRAGRIELIDGSRRSGHSNAYFTGFGRFRRIVLYDTLVQQLSPEELEAVLAHEIGHYRRGHIPKLLGISAAGLFAGFAALAALLRWPEFTAAFGFPPGALAPAFLLCGLLGGTVTFWLSPVMSAYSRRCEYEADAFARDAVAGSAPLVGALRRLAEKNLSNLTPHPLYSAFHSSHPTLVEREAAVGRKG